MRVGQCRGAVSGARRLVSSLVIITWPGLIQVGWAGSQWPPVPADRRGLNQPFIPHEQPWVRRMRHYRHERASVHGGAL